MVVPASDLINATNYTLKNGSSVHFLMYILPQFKKKIFPHRFGCIQRYKFWCTVMAASLHEAMVSLFKHTNNGTGDSKTWVSLSGNSPSKFVLCMGNGLRKSQESSPPSHFAAEETRANAVSCLNLSSLCNSPEIFSCTPDAVIHLPALFWLLPTPSPPRALCDSPLKTQLRPHPLLVGWTDASSLWSPN